MYGYISAQVCARTYVAMSRGHRRTRTTMASPDVTSLEEQRADLIRIRQQQEEQRQKIQDEAKRVERELERLEEEAAARKAAEETKKRAKEKAERHKKERAEARERIIRERREKAERSARIAQGVLNDRLMSNVVVVLTEEADAITKFLRDSDLEDLWKRKKEISKGVPFSRVESYILSAITREETASHTLLDIQRAKMRTFLGEKGSLMEHIGESYGLIRGDVLDTLYREAALTSAFEYGQVMGNAGVKVKFLPSLFIDTKTKTMSGFVSRFHPSTMLGGRGIETTELSAEMLYHTMHLYILSIRSKVSGAVTVFPESYSGVFDMPPTGMMVLRIHKSREMFEDASQFATMISTVVENAKTFHIDLRDWAFQVVHRNEEGTIVYFLVVMAPPSGLRGARRQRRDRLANSLGIASDYLIKPTAGAGAGAGARHEEDPVSHVVDPFTVPPASMPTDLTTLNVDVNRFARVEVHSTSGLMTSGSFIGPGVAASGHRVNLKLADVSKPGSISVTPNRPMELNEFPTCTAVTDDTKALDDAFKFVISDLNRLSRASLQLNNQTTSFAVFGNTWSESVVDLTDESGTPKKPMPVVFFHSGCSPANQGWAAPGSTSVLKRTSPIFCGKDIGVAMCTVAQPEGEGPDELLALGIPLWAGTSDVNDTEFTAEERREDEDSEVSRSDYAKRVRDDMLAQTTDIQFVGDATVATSPREFVLPRAFLDSTNSVVNPRIRPNVHHARKKFSAELIRSIQEAHPSLTVVIDWLDTAGGLVLT